MKGTPKPSLEAAEDAVEWGMENDASMEDIVGRFGNNLEDRGIGQIEQEEVSIVLQVASVRLGYIEGMPDEFQAAFSLL